MYIIIGRAKSLLWISYIDYKESYPAVGYKNKPLFNDFSLIFCLNSLIYNHGEAHVVVLMCSGINLQFRNLSKNAEHDR